MSIKLVNIQDIEELISAKMEIDKKLIETGQRKEKTTLAEFMTDFASLKTAYLNHGEACPFSIITIDNTSWVLHTEISDENKNEMMRVLKSCELNIKKLKSVDSQYIASNYEDLSDANWIVDNGKYYEA